VRPLGIASEETRVGKQNILGAKWIARERKWKSGDTIDHLIDDPTAQGRILPVSSHQEVERAAKAALTAKRIRSTNGNHPPFLAHPPRHGDISLGFCS